MKTPITTSECPKCKHPAHAADCCDERICDAAGDMDWCPCQINTRKIFRRGPNLTIKTVREMKEQLSSRHIKPTTNGMYFMVTTKANVRAVLKSLGFTVKEIREILKRVS